MKGTVIDMNGNWSFLLSGVELCIARDGEPLLTGITGHLKYPGSDYNILTAARQGSWRLTGNRAVCASMTLELRPYRDGFLLRSSFTNTEEKAITPSCDFTAFAGQLHRTIDRALINDCVSVNGNRVNEMQGAVQSVRTVYNAVYDSAENTLFETEEGDCFVFGQISYEKYFSGVTLTREGLITAHAQTEQHPIPVGGTVTSEWFWFAPVGDPVSGSEAFAEAVAAFAGVRKTERENPSGFCTWYYYGSRIRPEMLRQNMAVLDAHRDDLPVRYVQIDDGWFDCWGSWQSNAAFPDLPGLVREIEAHGCLAGIWVAPFGCRSDAPIFTEHPDWFVRDANGALCYNASVKSYCLDYTHPAVREYMGAVFRRLSYEWGFRYIKTDIISGTLAPGRHHDPEATALQNYRLGLQTIRENVTPDTFLLGCTAPLGAACGLVDGMRVSCDVFERWESLLSVFNAVLKRYYYHRNYYLIDADCLIIRKKENEDGECWRLCTRTDNEIRTYVTAMAASGGILMLADKLPNLCPEQLALISKLFPVNQECARPLDLMDAYIPGVLDFGVHGKARTVALINWSDVPRTLSVQNEKAPVFAFWEKKVLLHEGGTFAVTLPPRTAEVYTFTKPLPLCVIGSDASVKMQSEWYTDGDRLYGRRLKAGEHVFLAVAGSIAAAAGCTLTPYAAPDGLTVYEAVCDAETYSVEMTGI